MTDAQAITLALGGRWRGLSGAARCPCHDDRSPSLSIRDGDEPGRIIVTCFAGCDRRDIIAELRQRGLLDRAKTVFHRKPNSGNAAPDHKRDPQAVALWHGAVKATGSVVETYLHSRGITIQVPPSLRCGSTVHAGRIQMPTMLAAVQAPDGAVIAVQATLLTHAGRKAAAAVPRITTGALGWGAVRFATAGEVLGLAEGVETALSAMLLTGVPCWAALGAARMHRVAIPDCVRELHIFGDNDEPGRAAAERTAAANKSRRVVLRLTRSEVRPSGHTIRHISGHWSSGSGVSDRHAATS